MLLLHFKSNSRHWLSVFSSFVLIQWCSRTFTNVQRIKTPLFWRWWSLTTTLTVGSWCMLLGRGVVIAVGMRLPRSDSSPYKKSALRTPQSSPCVSDGCWCMKNGSQMRFDISLLPRFCWGWQAIEIAGEKLLTTPLGVGETFSLFQEIYTKQLTDTWRFGRETSSLFLWFPPSLLLSL